MASGYSTSSGAAARLKATSSLTALLHVALGVVALTAGRCEPVAAQSVAPACNAAQPTPAVSDAQAALNEKPDGLAVRMRLADALIDQGCYAQAASALEAGLKLHPHSSELAGKLRDVRSMLTEQTYIQNLTQAEDKAKLQHNQLRCSQLGDIDACNAVLEVMPNDTAALSAKANAAQASAAREAVADVSEPRAGVPPAVEPQSESRVRLPAASAHRRADTSPRRPRLTVAAGAASTVTPAASYSNTAPAGQTN